MRSHTKWHLPVCIIEALPKSTLYISLQFSPARAHMHAQRARDKVHVMPRLEIEHQRGAARARACGAKQRGDS